MLSTSFPILISALASAPSHTYIWIKIARNAYKRARFMLNSSTKLQKRNTSACKNARSLPFWTQTIRFALANARLTNSLYIGRVAFHSASQRSLTTPQKFAWSRLRSVRLFTL